MSAIDTSSRRRKKNFYSLLVPLLILIGAGLPASAADVAINIQANDTIGPVSRLLTGACIEDVNHEIYGGLYSQMIFGESFQEPPLPASAPESQVSGMWRPAHRGTAAGHFATVLEQPFLGRQSQQVSFDSGAGEWGIENEGLNRRGMSFVAGKNYDGIVWVRAEKKQELSVALESQEGSTVYARARLVVEGGEWRRLEFTLTPDASTASGRFTLALARPG